MRLGLGVGGANYYDVAVTLKKSAILYEKTTFMLQ